MAASFFIRPPLRVLTALRRWWNAAGRAAPAPSAAVFHDVFAPGALGNSTHRHGSPARATPAPAPLRPTALAPVAALRKGVRSVEEVRVDLTRLRERTRAHHTATQAQRDMSFAPTDFMDFAELPKPAVPQDTEPSGFAPTDFLDFGALVPLGPQRGR